MKKELKREIKELEETKKKIESTMKSPPKGRISCNTTHGIYQYFLDGKYISKKNLAQIASIYQHQYYSLLLPKINTRLTKLKSLLSNYENNSLDSVYNQVCLGKKQLLSNSIYKSMDQKINSFLSRGASIEDNDFKEKYPIETDIYTNQGEHVRSKSEKIIADELFRLGIPYIYEAPLNLADKTNIITLHPDFTAMNKSSGKIYYIEHFGKIDDMEYISGAINKLDLYERNGILLGKNLIILHETKEFPLNVKVLQNYIEEFLVD